MRSTACPAIVASALFSIALGACADPHTDDGEPIDAHVHYQYVLDGVELPTGDEVDNQLGSVLVALAALAPGLDLQASIDAQIDRGDVILLADVATKSLDVAAGVRLTFYPGETDPPPAPAPCSGPGDATCRHHLDGTGRFTVDASAATDAPLDARIVNGTLVGGPGTLTLRVSFGAATPLDLRLHNALAELHVNGTDSFGAGSKIGGAIAQRDLDLEVLPAIATAARATFDRDCPPPRTPPGCGCAPSSSGASLRDLFGGASDCVIDETEVRSVVGGLLHNDIDLDGDGAVDALSIGVGVTGVTATFSRPPSS